MLDLLYERLLNIATLNFSKLAYETDAYITNNTSYSIKWGKTASTWHHSVRKTHTKWRWRWRNAWREIIIIIFV